MKHYMCVLLFNVFLMFCFFNQVHASCDDGTHAVIDNFNGFNIYSNSPYTGLSNGDGDCQCTELIRRFYSLGQTGVGSQVIYTLHDSYGFSLYSNKTTTTKPQPSDVISFAYGSAGHVALIVEVTDSNIIITDQNWTDNPNTVRKSLTLTHNSDNTYTVGNLGSSYVTEGWARKPGYVPPTTTTTPTPTPTPTPTTPTPAVPALATNRIQRKANALIASPVVNGMTPTTPHSDIHWYNNDTSTFVNKLEY